MMIRTLVIGSMLWMTWPMIGNVKVTDESRAQQIESVRTEKEANLQPEAEPKLQRNIESVQSSLPYKLLTSGIDGFGVRLGQLPSGNGFAIGPQFSRSDFMGGRLALRV